ncbi:S-layer homology domain-containing protein [Peptococcus simiae]|uniref:S-layer homology domain-containing protein n=1 Tax=Peptococcus simiae TaxID=1643805 RepID=A0ABW9GYJ4_9FIRM
MFKKTLAGLLALAFMAANCLLPLPAQAGDSPGQATKTFIVQTADGRELGQFDHLNEAIGQAEKEPEGTAITILQTRDHNQNMDSGIYAVNRTEITLKPADGVRKTIISKERQNVASVYSKLTVENITIDGQNKGAAFSVMKSGTQKGTLVLNNCSIQNCQNNNSSSSYHAAITTTGGATLEIKNTSFINNVNKTTNGDTQPIAGAIYMRDTSSLTMTGGSFEGNSCQKYGGAIYSGSACQVTLTGVSFKNNSAKDFGGAVFAYGEATVDRCSFEGNRAKNGGAIYTGNKLTSTNNTWQKNTAVSGGAISASGKAELMATGDTFANNQATGAKWNYGGAVYMALPKEAGKGTASFNKCTFTNNLAGTKDSYGLGGALCRYTSYDEPPTVAPGQITLAGCAFTGNQASAQGGASYLCGDTEVTDTAFTENGCGFQGGAFYLLYGESTFRSLTFDQNEAVISGGAIGLYNGAKLAADGCTFTANQTLTKADNSGTGGAIFVRPAAGGLDLKNSDLIGNLARYGGALYLGKDASIANTTFKGNKASGSDDLPADTTKDGKGGYGGAVYCLKGSSQIANTSFEKNSAFKSGGAIVVRPEAAVHVTQGSSFDGNACTLGQGGAIQVHPYSYEEPCDTSKYTNLTTDQTTVFKNNKASALYEPPSNYKEFNWLGFKQTTFSGKTNPHDKTQTILKNDALLNNYDVNYKHPDDNSYYPVTYQFVAKETGQTLPEAVSRLLPAPSEGMIGALIIPPVLGQTSVQTGDGTWTFVGWEPIKGEVQKDTGLTFTGTWALKKDRRSGGGGAVVNTPDKLNTEDHYAYMAGYPDQTFGPNRSMSRAEVATMFTRLLKDRPDKTKTYPSDLTDIDTSAWYANPVGYAARENIVKGYPDGTFRPDAPISRAEFAAIASRFAGLKDGPAPAFTDLSPDHWAYESIRLAAGHGWIAGYPDNTFRPDQPISRAEVIAITNRVLNRQGDQDWLNRHQESFAPFTDMGQEDWYYTTIMEAVLGHDYKRLEDGKGEHWLKLNDKTFI